MVGLFDLHIILGEVFGIGGDSHFLLFKRKINGRHYTIYALILWGPVMDVGIYLGLGVLDC